MRTPLISELTFAAKARESGQPARAIFPKSRLEYMELLYLSLPYANSRRLRKSSHTGNAGRFSSHVITHSTIPSFSSFFGRRKRAWSLARITKLRQVRLVAESPDWY